MTPAMPPLFLSLAVVPCPSIPPNFLTRVQRFRRGTFPGMRNAARHPYFLRGVRQQTSWRPILRALAGGSNLSHDCTRLVIVMVET